VLLNSDKKSRRKVRCDGGTKETIPTTKCPKCGGAMVNRVCIKCHYSPKTAYKNRKEAKEYTFAAD